MQISDTIADLLTRIRNAATAKHATVDVPASNVKKAITQILTDEGYVKSFQVIDDEYRKLSKENAGLIEGAARLKEENKQLSGDKARLFDQVVLLEKTIEGLKKDLVERDAHIDKLLSMMQGSEAEGDGE